MKLNELKEIIRESVKEIVKEELPKYLLEMMINQKQEPVRQAPQNTARPVVSPAQNKVAVAEQNRLNMLKESFNQLNRVEKLPKANLNFKSAVSNAPAVNNGIKLKTGNSALDQVLSQTAIGFKDNIYTPEESYEEEDNVHSLLSESAQEEIRQIAPDVHKALNKDYSKLLKAMDKKANQVRPV